MVTYRFVPIDVCNMCGADERQHRLLGRRLDRSQGWRPRKQPGAATSAMRCRSCGLVFSNPMPLPTDLAEHYAMDPVEYFGGDRVEAGKPAFQTEVRIARMLLPDVEGGSTLDIGAGTGRTMSAMRDAGFDAWGLEPSSTFRESAIQKFGFAPDRLTLSSIEDASYARESFDFVTFGAVLEHLADPSAALEAALSWLRPNGIIHVEVPSTRWLIGRLLNLYYRLTGSGLVTNLSPMHPPYHLYEFTVEAFVRNGRRLGYEVARTDHYVGDTFVGGLGGRLLRRLMLLTHTEMQLVVWLRRRA